MDKGIYQLLGLARKAGGLVFGDQVINRAKLGTLALVVVAANTGQATIRKIKNACAAHNIEMIVVDDCQALSHAVGKRAISNLGVTNAGLAQKIIDRRKTDGIS